MTSVSATLALDIQVVNMISQGFGPSYGKELGCGLGLKFEPRKQGDHRLEGDVLYRASNQIRIYRMNEKCPERQESLSRHFAVIWENKL